MERADQLRWKSRRPDFRQSGGLDLESLQPIRRALCAGGLENENDVCKGEAPFTGVELSRQLPAQSHPASPPLSWVCTTGITASWAPGIRAGWYGGRPTGSPVPPGSPPVVAVDDPDSVGQSHPVLDPRPDQANTRSLIVRRGQGSSDAGGGGYRSAGAQWSPAPSIQAHRSIGSPRWRKREREYRSRSWGTTALIFSGIHAYRSPVIGWGRLLHVR